MAFTGFPRKVRFTPVPNPLFGPLIEQIDDLGELKCTLRLIWLLHQKKGDPRYVSQSKLLADRVLLKALAGGDADPRSEIERSLTLVVRRGTFVTATVEQKGVREHLYTLNTEAGRRALAQLPAGGPRDEEVSSAEPSEGVAERPNIFRMYEDNIGMLSPMIAEELKEAEDAYPPIWIEDAFRRAVSSNKRSWRYIAAILERWEREGRDDGGTVRGPKKAGYY